MAVLNVSETLTFFDCDPDGRKDSNALNTLMGEELAIALLTRCLSENGHTGVARLPLPCTPGTEKGKRLDAWICGRRAGREVLYQVEVKNWCAHSLHARYLSAGATSEELSFHADFLWKRYWNSTAQRPRQEELAKVLLPMRPPAGQESAEIEPLACVWDLIRSGSDDGPLFRVDASGSPFSSLWWFSMSAYLRELQSSGVDEIEVELPNTIRRLTRMARMVAGR